MAAALAQPGILAPLPPAARHLFFACPDASRAADALRAAAGLIDGDTTVAGFGTELLAALGKEVPGLRPFAAPAGSRVPLPATPAALWLWLRGSDRGELLQRSWALAAALQPAFTLDLAVDAFVHADGRDLTGYEDGTENPQADAAVAAAIVAGDAPPGLAGSSFAALQQWQHDMAAFAALGQHAQDNAIGRRRSDNEELEDAPESAHVKRTAQEAFDPAAFVLRRSMPWNTTRGAGLLFVAFGSRLDAFEAQLRRMSGAEDGIVDALFRFTRPLTGATFWCPPRRDGRLDLRALGL